MHPSRQASPKVEEEVLGREGQACATGNQGTGRASRVASDTLRTEQKVEWPPRGAIRRGLKLRRALIDRFEGDVCRKMKRQLPRFFTEATAELAFHELIHMFFMNQPCARGGT